MFVTDHLGKGLETLGSSSMVLKFIRKIFRWRLSGGRAVASSDIAAKLCLNLFKGLGVSKVIPTIELAQLSDRRPLLIESAQQDLAILIISRIRETYRTDLTSYLNKGVCAANFPLNDLYEELVIGDQLNSLNQSGARINFFGCFVLAWTPLEAATLPSLLATNAIKKDPKSIDASEAFVKYTDQYFLLFNRLSFFQGGSESVEVSQFLFMLGKLIADQNFRTHCRNKCIAEPSQLDRKISAALRENRYQEVFEQISLCAIQSGMIQKVFCAFRSDIGQMLDETNSPADDVKNSFAQMVKWLNYLDKSYRHCHQFFFKGKDKFENLLSQISSKIEEGKIDDIDQLSDLLAIDHYAFESYKKIVTILHYLKKNKLLQSFYDAHHIRYNHLIIRPVIARFYLSIDLPQFAYKIFIQEYQCKYNRNDLSLLESLVSTAFQCGYYKEGLYWCKKFFKRKPHDESTYNRIGVFYRKLKKPHKAIRSYRKGIKYHPFSFKLHYNLAIALAKAGKHTESKKMLDKSQKLKNIT